MLYISLYISIILSWNDVIQLVKLKNWILQIISWIQIILLKKTYYSTKYNRRFKFIILFNGINYKHMFIK